MKVVWAIGLALQSMRMSRIAIQSHYVNIQIQAMPLLSRSSLKANFDFDHVLKNWKSKQRKRICCNVQLNYNIIVLKCHIAK